MKLHDKNKILKEHILVLIDCGSSHSMAKVSLVNQYNDSFFKKEKPIYKTAAGNFSSQYNMNLTLTLDEFGRGTKIVHRFDLDESEYGIGYDMILGRDLFSQLNIDIGFSDGTIKWEDQLIPMKSFSNIWKNKHPSQKEIQATILRSEEPKSIKEATNRVVKILDSKY